MERIEHGFRLSSGREFYANCGIIGISPELEVSEGYDGTINMVDHWSTSQSWTQDEKKELAEFMIGLWKRFGES